MRTLLSALVFFSLLISCSNLQRVDNGYPPSSKQLMKQLSNSVPMVVYNGHVGSGILYKRDGAVMLLTAAHVVEDTIVQPIPQENVLSYGKNPISIVGHYPNSETIAYTACGTLVMVNPVLDYAILLLDCEDDDMCFVEFDFTRPEQGEEVFMVGSPSMDMGTISKGMVCHSHRHPKIIWNAPPNEFIQTDAAGGGGSSGGGIFSIASGKCLGMLVMKNGENNLMLSVPIDLIEADLQSSLLNKMTLKP